MRKTTSQHDDAHVGADATKSLRPDHVLDVGEKDNKAILSKNVPIPESRWGSRNRNREVLGVKHDKFEFPSVLWCSLASTAATQIHVLILFTALRSPKHDWKCLPRGRALQLFL